MLEEKGQADRHGFSGKHASGRRGRTLTAELAAVAKGAKHQIDALMEGDPDIARLEWRPVRVEITVRLCSDEETQAYQAHQEQWLAGRRQPPP